MERQFKKGDKVICQGLIGEVYDLSETCYGVPTLNLVSIEDEELTCTARECDCELYEGQDVDQSEALSDAYLSSMAIRNMGESLTDKYFRDGNH